MTKILSGKYAFDGTYIYYYAQLEPVESEDEQAADVDETYYMFRVDSRVRQDVTEGNDFELMSKIV